MKKMEWAEKGINVDALLKKAKTTEYVEITVRVIRETLKGYYIEKNPGQTKPPLLTVIPHSEVQSHSQQAHGLCLLRISKEYGKTTGLIPGD